MNRRFFYPLPVLIGVAMFIGGCGTTGLRDAGLMGLDRNRPWILLPSADVQQAKSLAMGSAVTKGWKIADEAGKRLLVRRPLGTAEAEAVVGEPISTPSIEVRTDFGKRRGGVAASVAAAVVGDKTMEKGEKSAVRVDVTESYKNELTLSLATLRRSWEEHHRRATAPTWPPPTKDAVSKEEGTQDPPRATVTPPPPEENAAPSIAAPSTGDVAVPKEADKKIATAIPPLLKESAAVPAATPSTGDVGVPVEERAVTTSSPITIPPSDSPSALNPAERPGVWTYYAERHARTQGCEPTGGGATLEYKYPTFEVHRIHCNNGQNLLFSCNAGACRGLKKDWVPPPRQQTASPGILPSGL